MLKLKQFLESSSMASMPAFMHMPLDKADKANNKVKSQAMERLNLLLGRSN